MLKSSPLNWFYLSLTNSNKKGTATHKAWLFLFEFLFSAMIDANLIAETMVKP
ncbi:hypothetical protein AND4_06984 [Vibrio sp. AND4]|nr:hypothetical protein AND4_06984 [Vibrio sp. AND4]